MSHVELIAGDNRQSLRRLIDEGVRVHSVVTDPPYGLVSVQKRFGKQGSAAARTEGNDGSFARLSGGFMGKTWDGSGIERDPEFWALVYEILLPGGYCFAFSGSRTGHWQACAMEMAGFIMHPMHGWVFGSGFPKAHAADKAIDKHLGVAGGFVPEGAPVKRMIPGADQHATGSWEKNNGREYQPGQYVPGSSEAAEWEGWAYGTQAQKPALEPIYLGQKPFDCKTGTANLLKHGVGAVNIDGCRVPTTDNLNGGTYSPGGNKSGLPGDTRDTKAAGMFAAGTGRIPGAFVQPEGRHPANLILDGSPEVVAMFPDSKSGAMKASTARAAQDEPGSVCYGTYGGQVASQDIAASSESAARFFHRFGATEEDYQWAIDAGIIGEDQGDPLVYQAKAGKADRAGSKHPTVKPIALMQYLVRHITPPCGVVLDPFAGSGTTAEAARREGFDCILMEAEPEYLEFLNGRFGFADPDILSDEQDHLLTDDMDQAQQLSPSLSTLADPDILIQEDECSQFVLDSNHEAEDDLLV